MTRPTKWISGDAAVAAAEHGARLHVRALDGRWVEVDSQEATLARAKAAPPHCRWIYGVAVLSALLGCLSGAQARAAGEVTAPYGSALCVSPYVVTHDRQVMAKVAHARGYDVIVGHSDECDVTLFIDSEDTVSQDHITYDETRRLRAGRANDLLTSWEAYISGGK